MRISSDRHWQDFCSVAAEGIDEYVKRLARYAPFQYVGASRRQTQDF